MTCVAMAIARRYAYGAADSIVIEEGMPIALAATPKIFRATTPKGEHYLVGAAGDWAYVLHVTQLAWPDAIETIPMRLRERAEGLDGRLIVAARGRLWLCDDTDFLLPIRDSFFAIGSGSPYAMGALAASAGGGASMAARVKHAVEVSARYCPSVRAPVVEACAPMRAC